ncbi:MAG: UPF0179 family protein [Candidatus Methanoplasma sp.]|jgi:uncharacterized protein (UPF0179 family)|nr:UPF0179 family protein [Candidatus Methanoplasma sp.]
MTALTLISESQAKEGNRFYYIGPQPECGDCRLKGVCFNLESGALYEIEALRDQTHECAFNEDRVRVVEIKKIARISTVPKKSAIEGSVITFQEPECKRLDCKNYLLCHPYTLENGAKCSVIGIEGNTECPIGLDLVHIRMI